MTDEIIRCRWCGKITGDGTRYCSKQCKDAFGGKVE